MKERLCFPYDDEYVESFVKDIEVIYDKMEDNISKELFVNRLLLSITQNSKYLKKIILSTQAGKNLNKLVSSEEKKIFIYGAGIRGKRLVEVFSDKSWSGIIDKAPKCTSYHNTKILNLEEFTEIYEPGDKIIISNMVEVDNIIESLLKKNISKEDICVLNFLEKENEKNIYFEPDCVGKLIDKEKIFVDIGCYDGKDSINYIKFCQDENVPIYAFEPDMQNFKNSKDNLKNYKNVRLFNIALSNKEEKIQVISEGEMTHISKNREGNIRTALLDKLIQEQEVGFIKIDVEGYEENVLQGASKIIKSSHPIIAVSIYHKKSDIWRIPNLLLEYNDNYRFYMRHYSLTNGDTVLYAIDNTI